VHLFLNFKPEIRVEFGIEIGYIYKRKEKKKKNTHPCDWAETPLSPIWPPASHVVRALRWVTDQVGPMCQVLLLPRSALNRTPIPPGSSASVRGPSPSLAGLRGGTIKAQGRDPP
jgi:hypothetical protein